MGRKLKQDEDLKVGHMYGYVDSGNQFKIIAAHKDFLWIEWNNNTIEPMYLTKEHLSNIIVLK